jgi:hypothetical protein
VALEPITIIRQDSFAGGMWSTPTKERIPANGCVSAVDALVDETGALYRRGGCTNFTAASWPVSSQILWVWQGTLTAGLRTVFATSTNLYSVTGGTITNLGAYTGMSGGANRPAVIGGVMYLPNGSKYDGTTLAASAVAGTYLVSIANRIVTGLGDTVAFSGVGTATFAATDKWKIPGGANIIGLAALRDSAVVFTDQGVWVISNMAMNLTDPSGNVQQRLDLYSPDMVLWGNGAVGVVGYQGGLIVPARDGVWLMRLGSTSEVRTPLELLSRPITDRYRAHIAAGRQPGEAAVFRGHYFLPVVQGFRNVLDFLVCRLDQPARPWTNFQGYGAAYGLTPSQDGQSLIGAMTYNSIQPTSSQLATMNYFDTTIGGGGDGAAGTQPTLDVTSRDVLTGTDLTRSTVTKVRVGYRSYDTGGVLGAIGVSYGGDTDTGTPRFLGDTGAGTGGVLDVKEFYVGKRSRTARFEMFDSAVFSKTAVQSFEVFVRRSGRL